MAPFHIDTSTQLGVKVPVCIEHSMQLGAMAPFDIDSSGENALRPPFASTRSSKPAKTCGAMAMGTLAGPKMGGTCASRALETPSVSHIVRGACNQLH